MDLLEKYLGESGDVRGVVKLGKVSLDTANDFQRQILNQSYYEEKSFQQGMRVAKAMGMKEDPTTLSQEEVEKILESMKSLILRLRIKEVLEGRREVRQGRR